MVTQLGQSHTSSYRELLVCPQLEQPYTIQSSSLPLTLSIAHTTLASQSHQRARLMLDMQQKSGTHAALVVGGDEVNGSIAAWARYPDMTVLPIDTIQIVGPGIHKLDSSTTLDNTTYDSPDRWSRLIGVIGGRVWRQIRELRVAIVGCGRTGSLVASSLARMGIGGLILIDPDIVEIHNLDAMDCLDIEAVGQPKTTALAETLYRIYPDTQIISCQQSVTTVAALDLLKEADILISCVDNDGARWAVGVLSSLYLKPLLDIGTGITKLEGKLEMGTDIRLVIPGDGCIQCAGGFVQPGQVVALRVSATTEVQSRRETHWQAERAGSLHSLNQIAVGLSIREFESFLMSQSQRTQWTQLYFDSNGLPTITRPKVTPRLNCNLCALQGKGDSGLIESRRLPQPGLPRPLRW